MLLNIPLHPATVHFPIAFLLGAAVLYLIYALRPDKCFEKWAFYMHIVGLGTMLIAILSGRQAQADATLTPNDESLLNTHEISAYALVWIYGMLLVWQYLRLGRALKWEKMLFAVLFAAASALMFFSAHLGGRLVFEEGVGVLNNL